MNEQYSICVRVEDAYAGDVPTCKLREALAHTLEAYGVAPCTGVTILVTDDEAVRKLNARYRGVDAPTDVLSFPAENEDLPPGLEEDPYLGDILIAYPYTAAQASQDGHNLGDMLILLAVHGALHLLGFDHDSAEHQAAMWAAQAELLKALGVPQVVIPAPHDYSAEESA
jgi:probable rRNA maturation factor